MFSLKPHHYRFMAVCFVIVTILLGLYAYKRALAAPANTYQVTGHIYYDMDFSNTITAGDPIYKAPERPFIAFHLYPSDRYARNDDGTYRFKKVPPGDHTILIRPDPPYKKLLAFPGGVNSQQVFKVTNSDLQNLDFLVQPYPFRGKVYKDENGNGLWDALPTPEPFVAGATIVAYRRGTGIGNFQETPDRTTSIAGFVPFISNPLDITDQYNYLIGGPAGSYTLELLRVPPGCEAGGGIKKGIDYEGYDEQGNKTIKNFNPANFALIDTPDPTDPVCGTTPVPTVTPTVSPSTTPTPTPTPTPSNVTVSGTIYRDDSLNHCIGGMNPWGGHVLTLFQNGVQIASNTSSATGTYTLPNVPTGNSILSIAPIESGYRVIEPIGDTTFAPYNNYPFNLSSDKTVNFCLTTVAGWFQTDMSDVRFANRLINLVPVTQKASTDSLFPSIFFSSTQDIQIPSGRVSDKNWKVEYEYSPTHTPEIGHLSYSYFESVVRRTGILKERVSCANDSTCTIIGAAFNGVVELQGNSSSYTLTGPGGKIQLNGANKQIIILSEKPIAITAEISVDPGSLFIVATKDTLTVDSSIGEVDASSPRINLAGIFSAEKEVILDGAKCNDGDNPDLRLNVAGTIITNAKQPFQKSGSSIVVNRSLCALPGGDPDYPVLSITDRPDFIMALGDEYKFVKTKWNEIYPE